MDAWRYGIYLLLFYTRYLATSLGGKMRDPGNEVGYLARSLRSLVRYRCEHSKINSISPSVHVLFSMFSLSRLLEIGHQQSLC